MNPDADAAPHHVGLVVNPTAGKGRGARVGPQVGDRLVRAGHTVEDLSAPNAGEATDRARRAVAGGRLDALVVVGGDGMVHLGAQAVAGTGTALGIVAVGTGNDFAASIGLPVRAPDRACAVIDAALAAGTARPVDAIRVTVPAPQQPADHIEQWWVAGAVSAGLDAAVNARANAMRRPRGGGRYTLAAVAEIVAFRAWGYTLVLEDVLEADGLDLTHDGRTATWTGRAAMVTAANTDRIGGGIRVAPDARVDDGLLDILVAPVLTRTGAATIFPSMFSGRHVRRRDVHVLRARAVTIAPASDDAMPDGAAPGRATLPDAHGDGERLAMLPVTARAEPGALRILAP